MKARFTILPLALALLAAGSVGASSGAETAGALAHAVAIRVVVPGGGASTPTISSPPSDAVAPGSGFSYSGSEGPAVTADSYVASVQSDSTGNPFANASAEVTNLSLFDGEVTASDVVAHAKSSAKPGAATGDLSGAGVSGLVVDGQPAAAKAPEGKPGIPPIVRPPAITPKLTAGGYVFPVYGPSSFTDTFGAFRGDVSGGWHHGDDIFAPLGAPILAVASGTVFSVGWNEIGGNRLWLRDGQGNLFYYAHLSAFSPLAVNGNRVNAGAVLGFVGNTGDAEGTPYHLHFEIHPVGLLGLGYDGAVDPTSYLTAWKHLLDVSFAGGNAWAPKLSGSAPKPGAILIAATDISTADGLDPGSLQRALAPAAGKADAYVISSRTFSRVGKPGAEQRSRAPDLPH